MKDLRRDDHRDHKKAKESAEIALIRKKIEQINWLKQKSVLELADLLGQHKEKHPQLLAAIMPDAKSQILMNPHFFKHLEQIERQDPINKKVEEVRQFITALKSQTYERHMFSDGQDRTPSPVLTRNGKRRRNQLSRSIAVNPTNATSLGLSGSEVPSGALFAHSKLNELNQRSTMRGTLSSLELSPGTSLKKHKLRGSRMAEELLFNTRLQTI